MYIRKITLNNFGSYYGKISFDFEHDTGRPGYAIFGDIGRGKTTLVKSILWCLYGRVEAIRVMSTGKTLRADRPCIDAEQMIGEYSKKFNLPLLNFRAYTEGDFEFSVEIEFDHDGRKHHLVREIVSQAKLPRSDNDIAIKTHLTVDGRVTSAALIQPKIEEIIELKFINIIRLKIVNKNNDINRLNTPILSLNQSPHNLPMTIKILKLIVAIPTLKPSTLI